MEPVILLESTNLLHEIQTTPTCFVFLFGKSGKPALLMCAADLKHDYSSKYSSGHLSVNCEALVKNKMEIQISK